MIYITKYILVFHTKNPQKHFQEPVIHATIVSLIQEL